MTKLRDVMKLDDNPHVEEWGPFPGPSSLLPEFLKVRPRHRAHTGDGLLKLV